MLITQALNNWSLNGKKKYHTIEDLPLYLSLKVCLRYMIKEFCKKKIRMPLWMVFGESEFVHHSLSSILAKRLNLPNISTEKKTLISSLADCCFQVSLSLQSALFVYKISIPLFYSGKLVMAHDRKATIYRTAETRKYWNRKLRNRLLRNQSKYRIHIYANK